MALSTEAQVKMFGKTIADMEAEWTECASRNRPAFYITCIVSDIQEAMAHGDLESARQWANKVKYFLSEKF